jgi:multidrug resistance efflux pump
MVDRSTSWLSAPAERETAPAPLTGRGDMTPRSCGAFRQEISMESPPRRWLWIAGLLLLVGTAAGAGWVLNHSEARDTSTSRKPADSEFPTPQGIICFGFGDVEPGIANLYPVQAGEVVEVAAEGAAVRKGDVLVRLDSRLQEIEAAKAKVDWEDAKDLLVLARPLPERHTNLIEQQKQAITIAQNKREVARQQLELKQKAYDGKATNIQDLRGAQEELKAHEAEVAAEELKLKALQLQDPHVEVKRAERAVQAKELVHQKAKLAVDKCVLRAPEDGTVLRVLTHVGETLGAQPKMAAIEYCPKAPRIVRAEVLQEWASHVKLGQEAVIEDDTRAGIRWHGKVKHMSDWYTHRRSMLQEPFQYNDVRTLEAMVSVDAGGPPLRIGQRVRVTIVQGGP